MRWFEAELLRHRRELLRTAHPEAEDCFCRAITIARRQGAKLRELPAATSLARLRRDQGKRDEAAPPSRRSTDGSLRASKHPT